MRLKHRMISADELDACTDESNNVLELGTVVTESIDPVRIDSTLYLLPQAGGEQAFETLRLALGKRRAIGSVTIRDKGWKVALEARPKGFLVHLLAADEWVRSLDDLASYGGPAPSKADVALAKQLFEGLEGELADEPVHDGYTARVRAMIDAKIAGKPSPVQVKAPVRNTSLAEALAQSLAVAKPRAKKADIAPGSTRRQKAVA